MIHCISLEAATQVKSILCFDNQRILGEDLASKLIQAPPHPSQWLKLLDQIALCPLIYVHAYKTDQY